MTLSWLALDQSLTVDKCSSTTLLLTCRWYEKIYFVHSENSQEILWITFIKTHLQNYSKLLKIIKSITQSYHNLFIFIFNLSQWHVTLNQLSHEQLICVRIMSRASHRNIDKRRVNQVNENSKLKSEIYEMRKLYVRTERRWALDSIEFRLAQRTCISVEDWARS